MVDRRSFLKSAAVAAAAVPFHALVARTELLASSNNLNSLRISGYGPLVEALDEATGLPLLKLPEGFSTGIQAQFTLKPKEEMWMKVEMVR